MINLREKKRAIVGGLSVLAIALGVVLVPSALADRGRGDGRGSSGSSNNSRIDSLLNDRGRGSNDDNSRGGDNRLDRRDDRRGDDRRGDGRLSSNSQRVRSLLSRN